MGQLFTAANALPLAMAGLGAAGGALEAFGGQQRRGFSSGGLGVSQEEALNRALSGTQQYGAGAFGRAAPAVNVPVNVQPLPNYYGEGMAMPVGVMMNDPAWWDPSVRGVPAANLGNLSSMFPGATGNFQQPTPSTAPGLGAPPSVSDQMMSALEMLGVTKDPQGNLTTASSGSGMFTGAGGASTLATRTWPGVGAQGKAGNPEDPTYWTDPDTGKVDPTYFDEQPSYDEHGNLIENPDQPRGKQIG